MQIQIRRENLLNETGYGDAFMLFDEGDSSTTCFTKWELPGMVDYWPAAVVIDLQQEYILTGFSYFDGPRAAFNGTDFEHAGGKFELSGGTPFACKPFSRVGLSNDSLWHSIGMRVRTRYVRLEVTPTSTYRWKSEGPFICDPNLGELILRGYPSGRVNGALSQLPKQLAPASHFASIPMERFIGVNSFAREEQALHVPFAGIREYHHWKICGVGSVDDSINWQPGEYDFDAFYRMNSGKVCVDVHRHFLEEKMGDTRPAMDGDPLAPASYALISDYVFQLAARYGSQKVPKEQLRSKGTVITGTGWLAGIEVWNEPDRWWGKAGEHFTPFQLAAMQSAAFDGDQGRMGAGYGIKQADSSMPVVLGGLTSLDTSYIRAVKYWCDYHRKGSFPADVISFHHYCNTSGGQSMLPGTIGISPEADDFKGRMQKVVEWTNRNLPGCEVWLNEFGWDSSPNSPQAACGHKLFPASRSSEDLQADWIIRAYLAGAAAGVSRMYMFMLRDEPGEGLFKSCGLVGTDGRLKKSWFYLSAFTNALKGTRFSGELFSQHPDVWIYRFSDDANRKDVFVIWCPTSDGTEVYNYMFSIPGSGCIASLIRLQNGSEEGRKSLLPLIHNMARIDVSETPLLILVNR